ncbi:hypothetical protein IFO70_27145 [Phormidium tenue FACHB-886]|nr:hypothetical protein [Phormidium tenue FACHB-886]
MPAVLSADRTALIFTNSQHFLELTCRQGAAALDSETVQRWFQFTLKL